MKYLGRGLLVFWATLMLLGNTLVPREYEHQVDQRKREYYPATVVDKSYYESCSKTRCSGYYTVVVEIDNGLGYESVRTTKDAYDSAYIGGKIRFERHITDPSVVLADYKRSVYYSFTFLIFIIVFARVLYNF